MPIKVIKGNIFTSNCKVIVNTVNCVGVMGAGLALECRFRYPDMHNKYKKLCDQKLLQIGKLWLYKSDEKWILNFPTKKDWKQPSKLEYIELGLIKFKETYQEKNIQSIAFPMLGADKGGLEHNVIMHSMRKHLEGLPIEIEIYRYDPKAEDDLYRRLYDFLTSNDLDSLSIITKLRKDYINKVLCAIQQEDIVQLNQLGRVKGVGIKTLEKLFNASSGAFDTTQSQQKKLF